MVVEEGEEVVDIDAPVDDVRLFELRSCEPAAAKVEVDVGVNGADVDVVVVVVVVVVARDDDDDASGRVEAAAAIGPKSMRVGAFRRGIGISISAYLISIVKTMTEKQRKSDCLCSSIGSR